MALLLALVAPVGLLRRWATGQTAPPDAPAGAPASTPAPTVPTSPDEGGPGVGDPYFPDYGSSGYDALSYTINISFSPEQQRLSGTTVITARASRPLRSFFVDLALPTERVRVNGRTAAFQRSGFADVRITPAQPIAAGAVFRVGVDYSGNPATVHRGRTSGWYVTKDEWTAAGEPEAAAWWFPSNDHPSDPATMDVSVRVPVGLQVVSIGRLVSRDTGREAGFDTWHWASDQPTATYLGFVSIGHYALRTGRVDGRPFVYAVSEQLTADDQAKAFEALAQTGPIVGTLESLFGPYPFAEVGGIVTAHDVGFDGLETQTRPIYRRNALLSNGSKDLMAHELAHMWFGDHVTLAQWNDIFLNEGYASWAQWGYDERTGGRSADDAFRATFDRVRGHEDFWRITMIDPGPSHLFDAVYVRGPLTLQALRNVMGDDAFLALARDWGQRPGSRSLEQWMAAAQAHTTVDLTHFFQAWIYAPSQPAQTPANGFPS